VYQIFADLSRNILQVDVIWEQETEQSAEIRRYCKIAE
jgi:hypothetical protein